LETFFGDLFWRPFRNIKNSIFPDSKIAEFPAVLKQAGAGYLPIYSFLAFLQNCLIALKVCIECMKVENKNPSLDQLKCYRIKNCLIALTFCIGCMKVEQKILYLIN
jgi:hypothetical protein